MDKRNVVKQGMFEMILAMFLMGTVGFFVIESGQSVYNVVFYRCLFGALFLSIYCYFFGFFHNTNLTKKVFLLLFLSGVFLVFNWVLLFSSFKMASISTSTVVYHIQPFFFVIIWSLMNKEPIKKNKFIFMMIAFIGLILISEIDYANMRLSLSYIQGLLLAITAALLWALSAVLVKKAPLVKPHLIVLIQLVIGIVVLYPFTDLNDMSNIQMKQWMYLLILGAVHSCLTYILMYSAYQKIQTLIVAVLTFIYPAVAILVDFVFYDKTMSLLQYSGVLLIMLSGFFVNRNIDFSFFSRRSGASQ